MGGEGDACVFQPLCCRTGVRMAGFNPVRHQDHGRRGVFVAKCLCGGDNSIRHRRASFRGYCTDSISNFCAGSGIGHHQCLNVGTISITTMSIGCQSKRLIVWQGVQKIAQNVPCDDDLVHTIHLTPHRARCIQNEHGGRAFLRQRWQGDTHGEGENGEINTQHFGTSGARCRRVRLRLSSFEASG